MASSERAFGRRNILSKESDMPTNFPSTAAANGRRSLGDYLFYAAIAFCSIIVIGFIGIVTEDPEARQARLEHEARAHAEKQKAEVAAQEAREQDRQKAAYEKACGTRNNTLAFVMIQDAVRSTLKAPRSAIFPYINNAVVTPNGNCSWKIKSYVDAQNGFGAMIRTGWSGTIQHNPNAGTWRVLSVRVSD